MRLADFAVFDRHVKVDAQENCLVMQIEFGEFSNHSSVSAQESFVKTGVLN
jgi:hypothetical protein